MELRRAAIQARLVVTFSELEETTVRAAESATAGAVKSGTEKICSCLTDVDLESAMDWSTGLGTSPIRALPGGVTLEVEGPAWGFPQGQHEIVAAL